MQQDVPGAGALMLLQQDECLEYRLLLFIVARDVQCSSTMAPGLCKVNGLGRVAGIRLPMSTGSECFRALNSKRP